MQHVGLFFVYLKFFKQTFQLSQPIIVKKYVTSKLYQDLNPEPLDSE